MTARGIWLPREQWPQLQKSRFSINNTSPEQLEREGFRYCVAEFTRTYDFPKVPDRIELNVSADACYRLWANGTLLGIGPAAAGGDFLMEKPLSWAFRDRIIYRPKDRKVSFLAQVQLQPQVLTELTRGYGSFSLTGIVRMPDGSTFPISAGSDWLCRPDLRRTAPMCYDGSIPPGAFVPAEEICLNGRMLDPEIPPAELIPVLPEEGSSFPAKPGTEYLLKWDRIYAAYPALSADGPVRVRVTCSELPERDGETEYVCLGGPEETWLSFRMHSTGCMRILVEEGDPETVIRPSLLTSRYPIDPRSVGTLETDDKDLDLVFDVCRKTLEICRQTEHLDSPLHQELLACTGDYNIEMCMTAFTFGDQRLSRADLRRTALWLEENDGRMFHTTYSLIWVLMLERYYRLTADRNTVDFCRPALQLLLNRFRGYLGPSGVPEQAPDYMFVDWTVIEGFSMHHPPRSLGQTVLTAFLYGALNTAASLFPDLAQELIGEAEALKERFNTLFFNRETGLYLDGLPGDSMEGKWLPKDPGFRISTRYPQILAVLFGLCPEEDADRLLSVCYDDANGMPPIQPYFMYFLLEAVRKREKEDQYTMPLIAKWKKPCTDCSLGLQEGWYKPEEGYGFDYSHAWGGAPAWHLPLALTGLRMEEPGYRRISLRPRLMGLKYAKVSFPTPFGMITVDQTEGRDPVCSVPEGIGWSLR